MPDSEYYKLLRNVRLALRADATPVQIFIATKLLNAAIAGRPVEIPAIVFAKRVIGQQLMKALTAASEGYEVTPCEGHFIVQNPDFQEDDGSDVNLVVVLSDMQLWMDALIGDGGGVLPKSTG